MRTKTTAEFLKILSLAVTLFILLGIIAIFSSFYNKNIETRPIKEPPKDFCGFSTYGYCMSDSDCVMGGCSNQICQSKNEEPIITTCEFKECYNYKKYNLKCRCIDNKCQWSQ